MWKKTIGTIRENPNMLWGFTIPVLITLGLVFPIYRSIILTILGDYARIDEVPNFQEVVRAIVFALPVVYVLMGVFVLPPLYGYVLKAVNGREINLWSKQGFLRYSWRVVLRSILAFFTLFGIFILLFLTFAVPNLGFTLYTIAVSMWGVFWIISLTSVIVEDRFVDSLPNTFFIGKRYYFKMYFTCTFIMLPAIGVSTWFLIYFHGVGLDIAHAVPTLNMPPWLMITILIAGVLILSVYYVFAQAFIYTYSMHYYISEKEKLDSVQEESQEEIAI